MGADYRDKFAKCPYYSRTKHVNIICGDLDGGRVMLNFANGKERDSWFEDLCCDSYKNCTLYRMLEENYVE